MWVSAIQLLSLAVGAQRYWLDREPGGSQAAAARREAAWEVMALLPRVAAGVGMTVRCRPADKLTTFGLVPVLFEHLAHVGSAASAAEAAQLMEAADAAASQLLPLAHALWLERQAGGQPQRPAQDTQAAHTFLRLVSITYSILKDGACFPANGPDPAPPGSAAEHTAAAKAARRLQVTALRLVHWAAGAATAPAWLAGVGAPFGSRLELYEACHMAHEAAELVVAASQGLAAGSDAARTQEKRRCVRGAACCCTRAGVWLAWCTLHALSARF